MLDNERMSEPREWLVLVYRVPSEPSRLRAAIWRRLKGLGALYLQGSVAALPASVSAERALRSLRKDVLDMKGTAAVMRCDVIAGRDDVETSYNEARNDEYEEILDKCEDFNGQIDKEFKANHFTYAELEENEEDLNKLKQWFRKVRERDVLGASRRQATEEALDKCARVLEDYAARVFREEDG